jgi:heat shock protein HslJ
MLPSSCARRVARFIAAWFAPSANVLLSAVSSGAAAARSPCSTQLSRKPRTSLCAPSRAVLAALSVAALCSACAMPLHSDATAAPPDPFNGAAAQLLDNTSWVLVDWKQTDGTSRVVPTAEQGAPITLALSTATGQRHASGFSGCNRYMGNYALKDGKLSFDAIASTRMACNTAGDQIEGAYLNALAHIDRTGVQMRAPQQMQLVLDNGDTLMFNRSEK